MRDACQCRRLASHGRSPTAMSDIRLGVQEVESFEQVLHDCLHQLFGERARSVAESLKRERRGLERPMH